MIENFTKDEIKQLVRELNEVGYIVKKNGKGFVFSREVDELFGHATFVSADIKKPILELADIFTDNYTKKGKNSYKNAEVGTNIETEYRRIIRGILEVLKPHYGKVGFRAYNKEKHNDDTVREGIGLHED